MSNIDIYTDGACKGDPGPGGFGYIIRHKGHEIEGKGFSPDTTNNRMELMGLLVALKEPIILNADNSPKIEVFSDSQYLVKGMKEWLPNWLRRNWKTAQGQPVENRDLWEVLYKASKSHKLTFTWVKGHSGHLYNERADYLANLAITERII